MSVVDLDLQSEYADLDRYLGEEDYERLVKPYFDGSCPTCHTTEIAAVTDCWHREQILLYKRYLASGIGELYMRLGWEDYEGDPRALGFVVPYLSKRKNLLQEGIGITLTGPYGTGKTMIAMLIGKELVKLGVPVYATTYAGMVEMYTAGWRDPAEKKWFDTKIAETKVLILDDVGKEYNNAVSKTAFDHVIRRRVASLRPTILTTNLDEDEVRERYGGGSLSILFERSVLVRVSGDDYRPQARQRALDEATADGPRRPIQ